MEIADGDLLNLNQAFLGVYLRVHLALTSGQTYEFGTKTC